jgi:hypothetical protein
LTVTDHQTNVSGPFADALRAIIKERNPQRILETGTYDGQGSTRAIAEAIHPDALFMTIEVSASNAIRARDNLRGLPAVVLTGLSLTRDQLPDAATLATTLASGPWEFIDHEPDVRVARYLEEQGTRGRDGLLESALGIMGGKPDLVLLDSAGHLGWLEFCEALRLIKGPCVIALDDTRHVKHCRSLEHIKARPEQFTMIAEGSDRCGWCIAEYRPA